MDLAKKIKNIGNGILLYKWKGLALFCLWVIMLWIPVVQKHGFDFTSPYPSFLMLLFYTIVSTVFVINIIYSTDEINTTAILSSKFVICLVIQWISFVLAILLSSLFAIGKMPYHYVLSQIGYFLFYSFLATVIAYAAYSVTLTKKIALFTALVLQIGLFLAVQGMFGFFNIFFSTVYFSPVDFAAMGLSPMTRFLMLQTHPFTWWGIVLALVLAGCLLWGVLLLDQKKRTKEGEGGFGYPWARLVVKYLLLFGLLMMGGNLCYTVLGVFGLLVFYLVFLIVYQIVFEWAVTHRLRYAVKNFKGILIFTAVFYIFVFVTSADLIRFDHFVPSPSHISSVKFMMGNGDDRYVRQGFTTDSMFKDTDTYLLEDPESIAQVIRIVDKVVSTGEFNQIRLMNGFAERKYLKKANETYFDLSVEYRTKLGFKIFRQYKDVVYSNIYEEFQALYSSMEYRRRNPIFHMTDMPNSLTIDNRFLQDKGLDQLIAPLLERVKQDVTNKTFDDLLTVPFAKLNFERFDGKNILSSAALTIYPSYENTTQMLEEYGFGRLAPDKKDIVAAYVYDTTSIVNYVTISPDNFDMFAESLPEPIKLTENQEIQAVLENALPVSDQCSYSPYVLLDKRYVIVPEFKKPVWPGEKLMYLYSFGTTPKSLLN